MAIFGKKYPLSIVIGSVDNATAGLRKINKEISRMTAPVRRLNNRLSSLSKEMGMGGIADKWRDAGKAMGGLRSMAVGLATGIGAVVAATGLGVAGIHAMVEENDALAKAADRVKMGIDAYAQLRFAFGQGGVAAEEFDAGVGTLSKSLGQAKAGTGRFAAFLEKVSPPLLRQMKAAKSTEEALFLMADAMKKIEDPGKRAALAAAAFGGSGEKMINLLGEGSGTIRETMEQFRRLAGSQEATARQSEDLSDRIGELQAAMGGVKALILGALAPALRKLLIDAQAWFVGNREKIQGWAQDFAQRLPGAIEQARAALSTLIAVVTTVWNAIGGAKGVAAIFGAVMAFKVATGVFAVVKAITATIAILSKLSIVIRLVSATMMTTPLGWIIAGVVALGVAAYLLIKHWDKVSAFFGEMWGVVKDAFGAAFDAIKGWGESLAAWFFGLWDSIVADFAKKIALVTGVVKKVGSFLGVGDDTPGGNERPTIAAAMTAARPSLGAAAVPIGRNSEARVMVDFANAPKGTRVTSDPRSSADVDLSVGYQLP